MHICPLYQKYVPICPYDHPWGNLFFFFFLFSFFFYQVGRSQGRILYLRIDYCDERVFQENSYISSAISLTHTYYISYEGQYFSVLDHTSNIWIGHKLLEKWIKNWFFHFYFLIQDFLLNTGNTFSQIYMSIHNIHIEGTVSQNFDIGPSFIFMQKNGKIFIIFSSLFLYIS